MSSQDDVYPFWLAEPLKAFVRRSFRGSSILVRVFLDTRVLTELVHTTDGRSLNLAQQRETPKVNFLKMNYGVSELQSEQCSESCHYPHH